MVRLRNDQIPLGFACYFAVSATITEPREFAMFKPLAALSVFTKLRPNRVIACCRILTVESGRYERRCVQKLVTSTRHGSIFTRQKVANVNPDSNLPDVGQPMESWYYDVGRDGKITVRSLLDVHIQPLDPQKYPEMNKLFISIVYVGKDEIPSSQLFDLTKQYIVNVDLDDNNQDVELTIKQKTDIKLNALCHIQVPISYGRLHRQSLCKLYTLRLFLLQMLSG